MFRTTLATLAALTLTVGCIPSLGYEDSGLIEDTDTGYIEDTDDSGLTDDTEDTTVEEEPNVEIQDINGNPTGGVEGTTSYQWEDEACGTLNPSNVWVSLRLANTGTNYLIVEGVEMTDDNEDATDTEGIGWAFYDEQGEPESGVNAGTDPYIYDSYHQNFAEFLVAPGEHAYFFVSYNCTNGSGYEAGAEFHIYTNDPNTAAVVYISVDVTY